MVQIIYTYVEDYDGDVIMFLYNYRDTLLISWLDHLFQLILKMSLIRPYSRNVINLVYYKCEQDCFTGLRYYLKQYYPCVVQLLGILVKVLLQQLNGETG